MRHIYGSLAIAALALSPALAGGQESGATTQTAPARQLVGNFNPTQQRTGELGTTGQVKVFGRIVLKRAEGDPTRTHVVLDISTPVSNATILWALHPGQCGSSTLPLLAINVFPAIDLGGNGRGHVEADIPLEFPADGQFHANVYNEGTGQGLEDVMTCASLRFEKQKGK